MTLPEIITGLLFTVLGTILSTVVAERERFLSWLNFTRNKNWKTTWECHWQKTSKKEDWVEELVKLNHFLGRIKIILEKPGAHYNWNGTLIEKKGVLVGDWWSKKPKSIAGGSMYLKIHPQGDLLVGYAVGISEDNKSRVYKILFTKDSDKAKEVRDNWNKYI